MRPCPGSPPAGHRAKNIASMQGIQVVQSPAQSTHRSCPAASARDVRAGAMGRCAVAGRRWRGSYWNMERGLWLAVDHQRLKPPRWTGSGPQTLCPACSPWCTPTLLAGRILMAQAPALGRGPPRWAQRWQCPPWLRRPPHPWRLPGRPRSCSLPRPCTPTRQ